MQKVSADNSLYLEKINYSEDSNALEKYLTDSREKIIKDIEFKNLKIKHSKDLTLEYLENLINNNELEQAIIKLCNKLEFILIYKYQDKESTFEELLNKFCHSELTAESPMIKLLHKLRKTRNNIVHPMIDTNEPIMLDEFNTCLKYIFSIDKD